MQACHNLYERFFTTGERSMNEYCVYCFEDISLDKSLFSYLLQKDVLCGRCRSQMQCIKKEMVFEGIPIYAFYLYNTHIESMLFQFKEGRDIALKECFLFLFRKEIYDKFREYTIVYMPSSESKNKERGFFPLEVMLEGVPLPKLHVFEKKKTYKQSLQSFSKRKNVQQIIQRKKDVVLPTTKLLLVDDVVTSGNTLLAAYTLLQGHPYEIRACVISVHPLFVENCDSFLFKK